MYDLNNSPKTSVQDLRINVCEYCTHKICSDCQSFHDAIANEMQCSDCTNSDCTDCYELEQALEFADQDQATRLDLVITR